MSLSPEYDLTEDDPEFCPGELSADGHHSSDYRKRGMTCSMCWQDPAE